QLDYFGARYYDRNIYRFISVDSLLYLGKNHDSQLMNLYSYSKANPLSYCDINGQFPVSITIIRNGYNQDWGIVGTFQMETPMGYIGGTTLEPWWGGSE